MEASASKEDYYTIEDIYHLPDGERAELIDGELYMMATPGLIHQRFVMKISNKGPPISDRRCKGILDC